MFDSFYFVGVKGGGPKFNATLSEIERETVNPDSLKPGFIQFVQSRHEE